MSFDNQNQIVPNHLGIDSNIVGIQMDMRFESVVYLQSKYRNTAADIRHMYINFVVVFLMSETRYVLWYLTYCFSIEFGKLYNLLDHLQFEDQYHPHQQEYHRQFSILDWLHPAERVTEEFSKKLYTFFERNKIEKTYKSSFIVSWIWTKSKLLRWATAMWAWSTGCY